MNRLATFSIALAILAASSSTPYAQPVQVEQLLSEAIPNIAGQQVRMSKVVMEANSQLPKHWHPGAEFAYVLSGKVTLWQQGQTPVDFQAGEALMIPPKQVHTAITNDEGVEILVFRVHPEGEPERIVVE